MQTDTEDPRLRLMHKWSKNMPQFSMQAAASGGDDDEDDQDDARSVRSSYSTYSHASHASIGGMFLGIGQRGGPGSRKYKMSSKGNSGPVSYANKGKPATAQAAPAAGAPAAAAGEGTKKRNKKGKKKGGKTTAIVLTTVTAPGGEKTLEPTEINKGNVRDMLGKAITELGESTTKIWDKLNTPSNFGNKYAISDAACKACIAFSTSGTSDIEIVTLYNAAVKAVTEWQINLKAAKAELYDTEVVKVPYVRTEFIDKHLKFSTKYTNKGLSAPQYKSYLLARVTNLFLRGIYGSIKQVYLPTPAEREAAQEANAAQPTDTEKKKKEPQPSLDERLIASDPVFKLVYQAIDSLGEKFALYEEAIAVKGSKGSQTSNATERMAEMHKSNPFV